MMGPNAVADVMPLGGRQTLRRGCQAFSLGFNNPLRCRFTRAPVFSKIGVFVASWELGARSYSMDQLVSCFMIRNVAPARPHLHALRSRRLAPSSQLPAPN